MRTFLSEETKRHHPQHQVPRMNPVMKTLMISGIVILCICFWDLFDWISYFQESTKFFEIESATLKQTALGHYLNSDWHQLIWIVATPAVALIGTTFFSNRAAKVIMPAAYAFASILLIATVSIQCFCMINHTQDPIYESLIVLAPAGVLFLPALKLEKPGFLLMATACFYSYVFAQLMQVGIPPIAVLALVLLYCIVAAWTCTRIGYPQINLILMVLALASYGVVGFKNFFISSHPNLLVEYFAFSLLFYFLFYAIEIYAAYAGPKPLERWNQLIFSWINFLVFLATSSYIMSSLYDFGILWLFALIILRLNVFGLKVINRFQPQVWTLPQYYIVITLVSLIIPLLFRQNVVLLFTGGLTVSMLVYANAFKDRSAMWFSLGSMATMIGLFGLSWLNYFIPAMLSNQDVPDMHLVISGTITGFMSITTLSLTQWLLNKVEIPFAGKWFRRSTYYRFIRGMRLTALFLTIQWITYSMISFFSKSVSNTSVSWFIAGSIYFIIMLKYYAKTNSGLKQKMFFFALVFSLTYPIFVQWAMSNVRDDLINSGNLDLWAIPMHYLALVLFVYLGINTFSYLSKFHLKSVGLERGIDTLVVLFSIFLACTEYDNASMILSAIANNVGANYIAGNELLSINQHLPYSIIIWMLVIVVYFRAVSRHNNYLRNIAVILMAGVITKIFAFDFDELTADQRNGVMLGLSLILIVLIYSIVRKQPLKTS